MFRCGLQILDENINNIKQTKYRTEQWTNQKTCAMGIAQEFTSSDYKWNNYTKSGFSNFL